VYAYDPFSLHVSLAIKSDVFKKEEISYCGMLNDKIATALDLPYWDMLDDPKWAALVQNRDLSYEVTTWTDTATDHIARNGE
jgi:hypothetical protein